MIWSWDTLRLDRIVEDKGTRVLYYLRDGRKRSFGRGELTWISNLHLATSNYFYSWWSWIIMVYNV